MAVEETRRFTMKTLTILVALGDDALSARDPAALAQAARSIADRLPSQFQPALHDVEVLARDDLDAARSRWLVVSQSVRDWIASCLVHRS
jgi:hypothetical protein